MLSRARQEVVCIHVSSPQARIRSVQSPTLRETAADVQQQMQPIVYVKDGAFVVRKDAHECCFLASLPAIGFVRYELYEVSSQMTDENAKSRVKIGVSSAANAKYESFQLYLFLYFFLFRLFESDAEILATDATIRLANEHLEATFSRQTGYLEMITSTNQDGGGNDFDVALEFVHYGARGHDPS